MPQTELFICNLRMHAEVRVAEWPDALCTLRVQLRTTRWGPELLQPPLQPAMLRLLQLECQSCKW